jgi:hypothetical protein
MSIIKTDCVVSEDGQLILRNLPFKKGKKLEIIIYDDSSNEMISKWKKEYLHKISTTSVWTQEQVSLIENAGKDINKWQIPG